MRKRNLMMIIRRLKKKKVRRIAKRKIPKMVKTVKKGKIKRRKKRRAKMTRKRLQVILVLIVIQIMTYLPVVRRNERRRRMSMVAIMVPQRHPMLMQMKLIKEKQLVYNLIC